VLVEAVALNCDVTAVFKELKEDKIKFTVTWVVSTPTLNSRSTA
jgi:hypothetical protein